MPGANADTWSEDALSVLMRSAKQEGVWNLPKLDVEVEAELVDGLDRPGDELIDDDGDDKLDLVPEDASPPLPLLEPVPPSETARLAAVDVHLDQSGYVDPAVRGLVLRYADGGVVSTGLSRGTTCRTLELDECEFISRLATQASQHDRYATNLIIETSTGRKWSASKYAGSQTVRGTTALESYERMRPLIQKDVAQKKAGVAVEAAEPAEATADLAGPVHSWYGSLGGGLQSIGVTIYDVAPGTAVWSVGFDANRCLFGPVLYKPLDSLEPPIAAQSVPSLISLARPIAMQALLCRAARLDEEFRAEATTLREASLARAAKAFAQACVAVRDSAEANEVRRLRHDLAAAEAALDARREAAEDEAWECVGQVQGAHDARRASIAQRRYAGHQRLLAEQQMDVQLAGLDGVLCAEVRCRKLFDPQKALRTLCDVAGCAAPSRYCGCTFHVCRSCRLTMCHFHWPAHEANEDGECDGRMRCGYVSDGDGEGKLHPECCNKLLDAELVEKCQSEGEEERVTSRAFFASPCTERKSTKRTRREAVYRCFNCNARVCAACCEFCKGTDNSEYLFSGRPCLKVWCHACIRPTASLCESCCRDCSFHRGRWV
mmetsp:Transcript_67071/g.111519  ORF Transcript_67071/g.111519 Transcript_67071/m.111519 type:complete len:605 (-) Transcript_67071:123-1937(-)